MNHSPTFTIGTIHTQLDCVSKFRLSKLERSGEVKTRLEWLLTGPRHRQL